MWERRKWKDQGAVLSFELVFAVYLSPEVAPCWLKPSEMLREPCPTSLWDEWACPLVSAAPDSELMQLLLSEALFFSPRGDTVFPGKSNNLVPFWKYSIFTSDHSLPKSSQFRASAFTE